MEHCSWVYRTLKRAMGMLMKRGKKSNGTASDREDQQ